MLLSHVLDIRHRIWLDLDRLFTVLEDEISDLVGSSSFARDYLSDLALG